MQDMRRAMFDTKRRMTQKVKMSIISAEEVGDITGVLDHEYKNTKKIMIMDLKKMLTRLASAIKSFMGGICILSESSGIVSASMMEMAMEQRDNGSKGYVHAGLFQEATATIEQGGGGAVETLKDAHESLLRKIADFKTIEKQIIEFEKVLLDVQAYERKYKDAETSKDKAVNAGTAGGAESAQAKLDKVSFKLSQSRATYNSIKDALWSAFEWYQRAGGLLAAQEAEALRAAQLSFFESSVAALRRVPPYGPTELTVDLNACSGVTAPPQTGDWPSGGGGGGGGSEDSSGQFVGTDDDTEEALFQGNPNPLGSSAEQEVPPPPPPPPPPHEYEDEAEQEQSAPPPPPPPPPPAATTSYPPAFIRGASIIVGVVISGETQPRIWHWTGVEAPWFSRLPWSTTTPLPPLPPCAPLALENEPRWCWASSSPVAAGIPIATATIVVGVVVVTVVVRIREIPNNNNYKAK
mmetsp:Transcript_59924/g.120301  ORF Transcript_59924/g.120301 Transcript_59924/m.120301 type:complete len:466 (-) Transcript_59924:852-2249(-)